jgi:hypothetical protein
MSDGDATCTNDVVLKISLYCTSARASLFRAARFRFRNGEVALFDHLTVRAATYGYWRRCVLNQHGSAPGSRPPVTLPRQA